MNSNFKVLISFLLLLQCTALLGIFSLPSIVYFFTVCAILSTVVFLSSNKHKINYFFIIFWFFTLISILVNEIPSIFQHRVRFLLFTIMYLAYSPLLYNKKIDDFRLFTFVTYTKFFLLLSILSVITLLVGITPINGATAIRGFQGIFNHPNTLGPIVSVAFLYVLIKMTNVNRYLYFALLICLFSITLLSGSRSVLLGIIVALLGFFYLKKYMNFSGILTAFAVLGIIYYLFINSYIEIEIITQKIEYSKEQESVTASRDILWDSRLKEFLSSPVYGIGFSAVDLNIYSTVLSNNSSADNGTVETGSAWFGVFSMTGFLGGVIFILLYFKGLKNCLVYIKYNNDYLLYFLVLVFFGIQFFFEGNVFAAGSPIILFFWTTISVSFVKPKLK